MAAARACRIVALWLTLSSASATASAQTVFINEIHYDNAGTDSGERIEIAGPSGTSVGGWTLVLYNGANGAAYDTRAISGTFGGAGLGTLSFEYPVNGIQNGAPDGLALVNGTTVVEFISYEGSFVAADGPAAGLMSVDIETEEDGTEPAGLSLQRSGGGCEGDDFVWVGPLAGSSGALNGGQSYDPARCGANPPPPPPIITRIYEIQGAGHISPHVGRLVTTEGIVTAVAADGYYVQDPVGDGDAATSDGIFVFVGSTAAKPAVGDLVSLRDVVQEFIPGGAGTGNLSVTELSSPVTSVLSSGHALPDPVLIGRGGRVPPNRLVISPSETPVNLQTAPGRFNPDVDGIDFYESLEGMRVTVRRAVAIAPTAQFGTTSSEIWVLPDLGAHVGPRSARTARGGLALQPHPDNFGDQNPERIQVQFDASAERAGVLYRAPAPLVTVGDRLGDLVGVVGYEFGNFEVRLTETIPAVAASRLTREVTALRGGPRRMTIATYNVLNLSADASDDVQRAALARQIVEHLRSPDVLALQEIQDDSGEVDDGVTSAALTLGRLAAAIVLAGGPSYQFIDAAPANNSSGGVPGGNIRNAFLYNPARVGLEQAASLTPETLAALGVTGAGAFAGTRAPLMAVFRFGGEAVTIVNNHLTSRSGSTPVFGGRQPFEQAGEEAREAQALALNEVARILTAGASGHPNLIMLGDFNTFEFTNDLTRLLPGAGRDRVLVNLIRALADGNVYTYNFEGNAQVLDHVFVSPRLAPRARLDIVHVNSDFPAAESAPGSDHEPVVLRLDFAGLPW
jgi:endonuclease/exonuclease/phosphatase family metal-dependent hydrolase